MAVPFPNLLLKLKVPDHEHKHGRTLLSFKTSRSRHNRVHIARKRLGTCKCSIDDEPPKAQTQEKTVLDLPLESATPAVLAPKLKTVFQVGDVVAGKYDILQVLGAGSTGTTFKCRSPSGDLVALKVVTLSSITDWKTLDLFKREARILESLDHPGIPKYRDYFEVDTDQDKAFVLVQELAQGRTLEDLVESGWRVDEGEISRIALQLLDIVDYLGSRRPPVTHRDIKPANIILEGGRVGGGVYLVDFGGVQAAAATEGDVKFGSTVVGTYGYMAPEQFRGAARPQSDLYGVGATLLYLLSGRVPSDFPQQGLRINFEDSVDMSPRMAQVVSGLMEPLVEDRISPQIARNILTGKGAAVSYGDRQRSRNPGFVVAGRRRETGAVGAVRKPAGARSSVTRTGMKITIDVPPAGLTGGNLYTGAFAVAWNAFVLTWTLGALAGGGILFALFSLPFWVAGAGLIKSAVGGSLFKEKVTIGLRDWRLTQQLALVGENGERRWADVGKKEASGYTQDIDDAEVVTVAYVNGVPQTQIQLREGVNTHVFGEGLESVEQEWLAEEINRHLQDLRQSQADINKITDRFDS